MNMIHSPAALACKISVEYLLKLIFLSSSIAITKRVSKQTIMMIIMLNAVNFSCQHANNFSMLSHYADEKGGGCRNLYS